MSATYRDYNAAQGAIEQLTGEFALWSMQDGWRYAGPIDHCAFEMACQKLEEWLDLHFPDGPPR